MVRSTRGVPKPRKEDLVIDDGSEVEEWRKYKKTEEQKPMPQSAFYTFCYYCAVIFLGMFT